MLIEGKFVIKETIQKIWDTVLQPGTLASCIPGTERMVAIDDKTYETIVKQKVGPIAVRLKFTTVLTETDPPTYVKAVGRGSDEGKMGTFTQETIVRLHELKKVKLRYLIPPMLVWWASWRLLAIESCGQRLSLSAKNLPETSRINWRIRHPDYFIAFWHLCS